MDTRRHWGRFRGECDRRRRIHRPRAIASVFRLIIPCTLPVGHRLVVLRAILQASRRDAPAAYDWDRPWKVGFREVEGGHDTASLLQPRTKKPRTFVRGFEMLFAR